MRKGGEGNEGLGEEELRSEGLWGNQMMGGVSRTVNVLSRRRKDGLEKQHGW